jgi:hypothetical protein
MYEQQPPTAGSGEKPKRSRVYLVTAAAAIGAAVGAAGIAAAATNPSSSSTTSPSASASAPSNLPDPRTLPNGPGETVLTGTTADKVKAAALAAVPNGTIIRVETDNEGSPYEAHVQKSDGTVVTVKVDSSFKVTDTITGFGAGGPGGPGHGGPPRPPAASGGSSSTTTG